MGSSRGSLGRLSLIDYIVDLMAATSPIRNATGTRIRTRVLGALAARAAHTPYPATRIAAVTSASPNWSQLALQVNGL